MIGPCKMTCGVTMGCSHLVAIEVGHLIVSIVQAIPRHPQQGKHHVFGDKCGMMAVHRSVGEFSSVREEWPLYIERLEFYFVANDIRENAKQRVILSSCCRASTCELILSLVAPSRPSEVSCEDIVEKVRVHHNLKPSQIVQRYKFNSRSQNPGESLLAMQLSNIGYQSIVVMVSNSRRCCMIILCGILQMLVASKSCWPKQT